MAILARGPQLRLPDSLPVLSRGRHRSARRGACFMEFASFLADEKWSDHPACTHPALATLARLVNDWTTDAGRTRLAPMIPSVVGLVSSTDDDEHPAHSLRHEDHRHDLDRLDLHLAVLAATAALPVASEARQRSLAAGLLRASRMIAALDGAPADTFGDSPLIRAAFDLAPHAEAWARTWDASWLAAASSRHPSSVAVVCDALSAIAIAGIGEACIDDADERLRAVLGRAIAACEREFRAEAHPVNAKARLVHA